MISLSKTLRALAEEPKLAEAHRERLIDAAEFVEANPKETFAAAWEQMQTTTPMSHDIDIRDALVRLGLMAWAPIMRERTRVTVANALIRYAISKGLAG